MDNKSLKKYKKKADAIIDGILVSSDFAEKEIVILAAAMAIKEFEQDCIICEELDSAEMYLKMHHDTGDPDYLEFARDELKHAMKPFLLLKLRAHYLSKEEISAYNDMLMRIKELEPALMEVQ